MRTLALAPMRVAPASSMVMASARVRMPPEALTPARVPAAARMRVMSSGGGAASREAGRSFEEVGAGGEGELGGSELFFKGEEAGFEDDFDDGASTVGDFDNTADVLAEEVVIFFAAGFEQAYVENHVNIVGAECDDAGGFVALAGREGGAEGEADDDADGDAGAGEGFGRGSDPEGIDHGAGEAVFSGLAAELHDLGAGGVGLEEGVIENSGKGGGRG